MKRIYFLLGLVLAFSVKTNAQNAHGNPPTWSDNIACIIYSHCSSCHSPGGIAPFSLMSYQETFFERFSIQYAVLTGSMPPWPPDSAYNGTFTHERILTSEEIHLINDWVNEGALQGNPQNAPTPPEFDHSSQLTDLDLTLQIPTYSNIASVDDYRCFVLPTGLTGERFITAWELIPGNYNMVHHVQIFQDTSNTPLLLDAADPELGYTSFGATGSNASKLIGVWTPGSGVYYYPDGFGTLLDNNARIILQIHYSPGTQGLIDSTKIHLRLSTDSQLRNVRYLPLLSHTANMTDGPLVIPADSVKTFHAQFTSPVTASVLSIFPHMHLLGKSIKSYGVTLTNDTIDFIDVPNWDFHWQGDYNFKKLVKIPFGTKLMVEATYDNTIFNPENPNDPPQTVTAGEATTDEMLLVYFGFVSPYQSGDENIVVDNDTHSVHWQNCDPSLVIGTPELSKEENTITIFPNPANSKVQVSCTDGDILSVDIIDIQGRVIFSENTNHSNSQVSIHISGLSRGFYNLRINTSKGEITKKLILQ